MIGARLVWRIALLICASGAPWGIAHAEGLQVAPVSVSIPDRSEVIWLDNGSSQPLNAQIRVFLWHQDRGEDELVETRDLVASPPFVEIPPNSQQIVRLVRFGEEAVDMDVCERSYRIIVDELPSPDESGREGLRFVLRYSIPVYLTNPDCEAAQPRLEWELGEDGDSTFLSVVNLGQAHAQLADVSFLHSNGHRTEIRTGLLGYVLPGARRNFALIAPPSISFEGGELEVSINGSQVTEPVSMAGHNR